jgi:hypothetical protein
MQGDGKAALHRIRRVQATPRSCILQSALTCYKWPLQRAALGHRVQLLFPASSPLAVCVPRGYGRGSIPEGRVVILLSSGSPCVVGNTVQPYGVSAPSSMIGTAAIGPFHLTRLWLPLETFKHHQGCAPI